MQISKYIYVTGTLIRFCYRRRIRIAFHNVWTLLDDGIEVLQKARFLQLARQLQWNTLAIQTLDEFSLLYLDQANDGKNSVTDHEEPMPLEENSYP